MLFILYIYSYGSILYIFSSTVGLLIKSSLKFTVGLLIKSALKFTVGLLIKSALKFTIYVNFVLRRKLTNIKK